MIGLVRTVFLIHYRMLKFYVRNGMIVDKVHDIISFRQCKWLEKYINFNTQKKEIRLKMILKKASRNYKTMPFTVKRSKI